MPKKDIENRSDIERIVTLFYEDVLRDPIIGFIFTDIVQIHLQSHLPIIIDFWQDVLFKTQLYSGNTLAKHIDIHTQLPLKTGHFTRWLFLFYRAVDSCAQGENAERMKLRAENVAKTLIAAIKKEKRSAQVVRLHREKSEN